MTWPPAVRARARPTDCFRRRCRKPVVTARRPLVARGLVDLDKLLGTSVSDYVRVHAPAPVLLVREPERRG